MLLVLWLGLLVYLTWTFTHWTAVIAITKFLFFPLGKEFGPYVRDECCQV